MINNIKLQEINKRILFTTKHRSELATDTCIIDGNTSFGYISPEKKYPDIDL